MAKKKGGDYEGWLLRLIDKVEDIGFSLSFDKWLEFAESKILGSGYESKEGKLTQSQKDALSDIRDRVWEIAPTKLNIQPEYITRFREKTTGRFAKAIKTEHGFRNIRTGRFVKVTGEAVERYRNLGGYGQKVGTTVSASKINAQIKQAKENKTWLKGEL